MNRGKRLIKGFELKALQLIKSKMKKADPSSEERSKIHLYDSTLPSTRRGPLANPIELGCNNELISINFCPYTDRIRRTEKSNLALPYKDRPVFAELQQAEASKRSKLMVPVALSIRLPSAN